MAQGQISSSRAQGQMAGCGPAAQAHLCGFRGSMAGGVKNLSQLEPGVRQVIRTALWFIHRSQSHLRLGAPSMKRTVHGIALPAVERTSHACAM
ncbi:hypothetical protein CesoFtcFv8_025129 [Champsocephalus esox]|uniref:Uncharacterized protein n=1 Tax=Champsocephalus esox TaxID=159716 RepID=A0AAN8GBW3_9TELE|nr:hypothetical protein CesoFtcFv8_025129 [Champsocephalus esox]